MANFIHRFLNPHCAHCATEKICNACEVLQMELERLRRENERLLDILLVKPVKEEPIHTEDLKAVLPKNIPWRTRQQMLENEDREKAKLLKQNTEDLEKELGVSENAVK